MTITINAYENSASISTTEYSLPNNSTSLTPITVQGIYQVAIDFSALTITEEYEYKIKEKVTASGSQLVWYTGTIVGPMVEALPFPSLILGHGWDVTVKKIAGTDRTIGWSIRKVA